MEAAIGVAVGQRWVLYDQQDRYLHNDIIIRIQDTICSVINALLDAPLQKRRPP